MGDLTPATDHREASAGMWVLIASVVGSSMSFIDGTAVNVALPVLQREFGASSASAQWVVESYSLFLSALILIGGSLGDRFGRKAVYASGILLFALASIACACATSIDFLILARCVQGIGGALATPGSLALISANFSGEARGRAIGTWSGASAITAVIGPVLGGALVQFGSWRWVFIINVPLAALVLFILATRVGESRDPAAAKSVDVPGVLLAALGLGALVFGLIRLQNGTLERFGIFAILAGFAALVAFVFVEARVPAPMIQLAFFKSRRFSAANIYTLLLYAAIGGSLYFVPFDLIDVQHYPPAYAGAALLPFIVIMSVLSRFSGGLVVRVGARRPLVLGAVLAAAGFTIFAFAGVGHSYWTTFFPGSIVLGLGGACFVAPLTTTVMDSLDSSHAGVASGINNAVSRTAGLLAIAALGIALANVFGASLERRLGQTHLSAASRAAVVADRSRIQSGELPRSIVDPAERRTVSAAVAAAFADGFRGAMLFSALLALFAAVVALDGSFRRMPSSR